MDTIHLDRHDDILIATVDHPDSPVNAVDGRLHHDFGELFRLLKREDQARAVILTGRGRAFSAGGDMAWFPTLRSLDRLHELRREAKQLIWDLLDVELPIVCGLNGSAAGLAASVALLCDVVVIADDAVIVDPHVSVGLVAGDGGAAIWPLLLGPLAAKRHLMLGDPLSAEDAVRLGVAVEACARDDVASRTAAWARRLADACAARRAGHEAGRERAAQAGAADELRRVDRTRDPVLSLRGARRRRAAVHGQGARPMTDAIHTIMTTRAIRRFSDRAVSPRGSPDVLARRPAGAERGERAASAVRGHHRRRTADDAGGLVPEGLRSLRGVASRASVQDTRAAGVVGPHPAASRYLADHLDEAPAIVLFLQPLIPWGGVDDEGTLDIGRLDASVYPAVQNFCLAARSLGLGTALTTVVRIYGDEVLKALGVPEGKYEIAACVPIGHPRGKFGVAPRRPFEKATHWNGW